MTRTREASRETCRWHSTSPCGQEKPRRQTTSVVAVGSLNTGGGSSAVAASAHAGCQRYRHTDPLVVGMSRRAIAERLGMPDTSAGIPEARWMRAMTFERLVEDQRFVSELLTTAVGALGLDRPVAVRRADGRVSPAHTATAIQQGHLKAIHENVATMITGLAVPFVGMEFEAAATPVKPDFAIVAPRTSDGSWLIMGDAKDYERVRSRIDDQRMLKGFLQVALGAESAAAWSALPEGMLGRPLPEGREARLRRRRPDQPSMSWPDRAEVCRTKRHPVRQSQSRHQPSP